MTLKGKTALVTGGSKGIGGACVLELATQGANVAINYAGDDKAAQEVAAEAEKLGVKALTLKADITDDAAVDAMMQAIQQTFGGLDVLVNNAGIFDENDSPDNLAVFERVFATDFMGQVKVTNAARKLMGQGKIVFISSVHGELGHGSPDAIAYSAAKAGLNSYIKNLAKALAPDILVNAVSPGRTLTPMWGEMDEAYKSEMASGHLIGRWVQPAEIADAVSFLIKNDAVCGEILVVDGGMTLKVLG